tara:strand:+ start:44 stop:508 length:465 start_codon:yes stop_codon:yes gene_type:complete
MFLYFKNHLNKLFILLLIILTNCQLQEPEKNHGILFLENRSNKLVINKSNKNDVINIIGQPHTKSIDNSNIWIYVERTLSKGKYHKLGKHVLTKNNTLVLEFDRFGILKNKKIFNKDDINQISFSDKKTKNDITQKSFVESFLSSIKQKMYGNK